MEKILSEKLTSAFRGDEAVVRVVDRSDGCGAKFFLLVVSDGFEGASLSLSLRGARTNPSLTRARARTGVGLLDRQRRVNKIIETEMGKIHAVTMRCWTRKQYEKKKASLPEDVA